MNDNGGWLNVRKWPLLKDNWPLFFARLAKLPSAPILIKVNELVSTRLAGKWFYMHWTLLRLFSFSLLLNCPVLSENLFITRSFVWSKLEGKWPCCWFLVYLHVRRGGARNILDGHKMQYSGSNPIKFKPKKTLFFFICIPLVKITKHPHPSFS